MTKVHKLAIEKRPYFIRWMFASNATEKKRRRTFLSTRRKRKKKRQLELRKEEVLLRCEGRLPGRHGF